MVCAMKQSLPDSCVARAYFEKSITESTDLPHRSEEVEVRMWYAWAHRLHRVDAGMADELAGDARRVADRFGLQKYVARLSEVLGLGR